MRAFILAAIFLAFLPGAAEARHHHAAAGAGLHPDCNILWPCAAPDLPIRSAAAPRHRHTAYREAARRASRPHTRVAAIRPLPTPPFHTEYAPPAPLRAVGTALREFGEGLSRPARFIGGRLVCAINVGAALAERGIKGTGSALALSYLGWGHSAGGPIPGAVIVSRRRGGGHVAIVSRVQNGVVYAWNASGHSGWREIRYRMAVLDYRVP